MKKIRLLSVLLTLCLLISMIPVYVVAEEGDVAKVGETGYATLKEAIDAVADGGTVEVLRDFDSADAMEITGKSFTLNGNGKTVNFTSTTKQPFMIYDSFITVKDMTMNYTGTADSLFMIRVWKAESLQEDVALSLTLDNCTVTSQKLAFKCQSYKKTEKMVLKLQNGTSVDSIGDDDTILINDSCGGAVNLEVTVDNSTVKKSNGKTSPYHPAMFMIDGNTADAPEKFVTVNVINEGHLICANGSYDTTSACGSGNYMFYGTNTANTTLTLNLDATAILELAQGNNAAIKYNSFIGCSGKGMKSVKLNDTGATWKISKESYAKTPYYPAFDPTADQTGWVINDDFYPMPSNLSYKSWPELPKNLDDTNGITMKLQVGPYVQPSMTDAEAITKGYVCRIGDEGGSYYVTLADAFGAVTENATVTMICDATSATALSANGKTFALNGNGKKLTGGVDGLLTFIDSTVTVRNLTLSNTSGAAIVIRTSGTATPSLTLEGCTVTSAKLVFKRQVSTAEGATGGDGLLTVTVKDSTVAKTGADDLMLINDTGNKNSAVSNTKLVIDNSTFTTGGGGSSNGAMFKIAGGLEKALTVELKNGAKLVAANNGGANVSNTIFESNLSAENSQVRLTVNAEEGTTLELAPGGTVKENRFVNGGFAELAIHDSHATWKVSKTAVDQGAYYPAGFTSTVVGIVIENKLYKPDDKIKLDAVEADATLNIIYLEDLAFEVLAGASVRTADPAGIRFRTAISHGVYELLKSCGVTIEFGSYIAPTAIVNKYQNGAFDPTKLERLAEGSTVKIVCDDFAVTDDEDGANLFYACLYGMTTKEQYEMALSVVSYITLTYENSASGETFLTSYNEGDHSRSMLDVARDAIAAGKGNDYLQSIVDACA